MAKVLWSEGVTLGKDLILRRFWVTPGCCRFAGQVGGQVTDGSGRLV
jgi:hypothetical protein